MSLISALKASAAPSMICESGLYGANEPHQVPVISRPPVCPTPTTGTATSLVRRSSQLSFSPRVGTSISGGTRAGPESRQVFNAHVHVCVSGIIDRGQIVPTVRVTSAMSDQSLDMSKLIPSKPKLGAVKSKITSSLSRLNPGRINFAPFKAKLLSITAKVTSMVPTSGSIPVATQI